MILGIVAWSKTHSVASESVVPTTTTVPTRNSCSNHLKHDLRLAGNFLNDMVRVPRLRKLEWRLPWKHGKDWQVRCLRALWTQMEPEAIRLAQACATRRILNVRIEVRAVPQFGDALFWPRWLRRTNRNYWNDGAFFAIAVRDRFVPVWSCAAV
jgi:hypothetical protein